ncbi:CsbD family protein [Luteipulveratus mongoliensis]|uniref:CsbD family protein n=1 Tax=Luteipulveratus mongoliensis TaxID=571913 RepID=UPI0009F93153|nr:CsbD family protein [Luteipulveratus mongoliensis]
MSFIDKAKNAAEDAVGKAKEALGGAKGDTKLETEGKVDQAKSSVKDAGEDIKDTFKK